MLPSTETVQETKFWLELERELRSIDEQLKSPEAETTLSVLRQGRRFITTSSFDTDTIGLKKAMEKGSIYFSVSATILIFSVLWNIVESYKTLMKDFPINDLLQATEISKLAAVTVQIFTHLKKTAKSANYPTQRYLKLLEAIGRDVSSKILSILQRKRLMHLAYEEFESITGECKNVFAVWDENFEEFKNLLRDLAKRRGQEKLPIRIDLEIHRLLVERIASLRKFRKQHNELRTVITRVLPESSSTTSTSSPTETSPSAISGSSHLDALSEITEAYNEIRDTETLLLSTEGAELWESAQKKYDSRIYRVESHITAILRDKLATAKNANEMFRIFSKFNALFVRPRIKGAIQEYQAQLIQRVKQGLFVFSLFCLFLFVLFLFLIFFIVFSLDIDRLHEIFKKKYKNSEDFLIAQVRDIPPISGAIIWAKQLERQVCCCPFSFYSFIYFHLFHFKSIVGYVFTTC
jgi:dynein heavy chain 1